MLPVKLSILELGEYDPQRENLNSLIEYATVIEKLGFARFWMGEHYLKGTLFSNPEPLIPLIAASTQKISVGVAGLLAFKHSCERLACSFSLLEKLFPKRIDLGLVAPSSIKMENQQSQKSSSDVFKTIVKLFEEGSYQLGIDKEHKPELWHLTSSIASYVNCEHTTNINLSKSLFHPNSFFDKEESSIEQLKDISCKKFGALPKITIAIGCFVCTNPKTLKSYNDRYKSIVTDKVFEALIIDTPENFINKLIAVSTSYQTNDIIIMNLGESYLEKIECATAISETLKLQNA